jgi:hypothetical protein
MDITLRVPTDTDWTDILRVANEARFRPRRANAKWLANRRAFGDDPQTTALRR